MRHTVARLLQLNRYDLAHIHWLVPNAALLTDLFASSALPTVISLHGSDVFMAEKSWLARGLARRAIRDARAITACSSDLRERVLRLGAEAATTRTVPYGVDTQQFTPGSASPAFRARFGIASDAVLVMAMGRLVEKKGFSYLIEAMRGLAPARLIIVGAGDLRAELEQQARAARIDAVFAGNLARTDVVSALQAADIFVVPSIRDRAGNLDGLPNTLLEALAAGKAIAASRIAGIPEVVRDEENGLLVPEQDSQALRSALARLIADATWRGRLARAARETAVQQLSWEATALRFEECYAQATTLDAR
jgi:glycosyltransferase involved in cell wall biosynthesis